MFLHGAIYTVDQERTWASALAVKGGLIAYVGDESGAEEWIDEHTEVTDLAGRMMLPGFHDSHIHLLIGVATSTECDLLRGGYCP